MRLVHRSLLHQLFAGLAFSVWVGISFGAETSADDSEAILQRIRNKVAEHLSRLPNFTCHEVIDRLVRPLNSAGLSQHDRVEIEVAFVGNRELFARPGESSFQEQSISKVVKTGTISSGVFGSHAVSIFVGGAASFEYAGVTKKDGHKTYRYDFQVPLEKSHFLVRHDSAEGIVAYEGSFWADFENFELVRLEIKADHIPSYIGVRFVKEKVRYSMAQIRDSEVLLPLRSELEASDSAGNFSLNDLTLEQCREFTGESTVTFGAPLDHPSAARDAPDR